MNRQLELDINRPAWHDAEYENYYANARSKVKEDLRKDLRVDDESESLKRTFEEALRQRRS